MQAHADSLSNSPLQGAVNAIFSAVVSAAGNVIILGADPANHASNYAATSQVALGARKLIADGIAYAAGRTDPARAAATTGAYICLSQYFYFRVRAAALP